MCQNCFRLGYLPIDNRHCVNRRLRRNLTYNHSEVMIPHTFGIEYGNIFVTPSTSLSGVSIRCEKPYNSL